MIGVNRPIDAEAASEMAKLFLEVIAAPGFDEEARKIFSAKKNLRLVEVAGVQQHWVLKNVSGGVLLQDNDVRPLKPERSEGRDPAQAHRRRNARPAVCLEDLQTREVERHPLRARRTKRGRGRRPDEPRRFGQDRRHEGRAAAQRNGRRVGRVLPVPRWRGGNCQGGFDGRSSSPAVRCAIRK